MVLTSRPAGVREEMFRRHFHRIQLKPLRDDQQSSVIEMRLGAKTSDAMQKHCDSLKSYVLATVPRDVETGDRITGNRACPRRTLQSLDASPALISSLLLQRLSYSAYAEHGD